MNKKLFIVVNSDWFFLSHRLPLALAAMKEGYDVTVVSVDNGYAGKILAHGLKFINIPLSRSGKNIFKETGTLYFLYKLYKTERPAIVHHVTVKPVLYGSLAARVLRIPFINALSGLGYIYSEGKSKKILQFIVNILFEISLNDKLGRLILQNPDDIEFFIKNKIIKKEKISLIKGSGVDCSIYEPGKKDSLNEEFIILLHARMIWEKGIKTFYESAKIIKQKYPALKIRFILAGKCDQENPAAVPLEILKEWHNEGYVEYLGYLENVNELLQRTSVSVQPSYYREGVPRSLIEAAAAGLPIITTDMPGCREVVEHGINGYLVPVKDPEAIVKAVMELLFDEELRKKMGTESRLKALREFQIDTVIDKTMDIYQTLLTQK